MPRLFADPTELLAKKEQVSRNLERAVKACDAAAHAPLSIQAMAGERLRNAIAVAEEFEVIGREGGR